VLAQSGAKGWADPDVRAKMYAAWTGGAKSILEFGGYSPILADAMIDVGTSSLSPVPRELDVDDKLHLTNVLSAVHQYRGATKDWQAARTIAGLTE